MPNFSLTVPETSQSVSRPITFDIIRQVQEITKIDKDTKIFFAGDIQKMQTAGTSIDSDTDRFAIFNSDRYAFIELEEDYDHDALGSTAVTRKEHNPVFIDDKLKVIVAPVYATSNIVINFKYRCPSKTEALRWRDDIRIRVSQMRDLNLHSITYHYMLPTEILLVLKAIYDKRETYLGYGQTFEEYVIEHASDRLTLIGDLVGNDCRLAISETQMRIIGLYGFDGIPEKAERNDSNGMWEINFSYKFSYEKPIACTMKYPIIVHNQLLPANITTFTDTSYDLDKVSKSFSISLDALNSFESDTLMNARVDPNALLRLPSFDDYVIPFATRGTGSVFIALAEVDIIDNRTLFNLDELGSFVIDPDIMAFIKGSEYPYICKLYKSIIQVELYRNEFLTSNGTILCDSSANIKASQDLDLRNQHRVRFSLVVDLTMLDRAALDRLRKYPKALVKIIAAMNELLKNRPDFNDLGDLSSVSWLSFSAIYTLMTGFSLDNGTGTTRGNWYNNGKLFANIDPRIVENYRRNRININTVEVTSVISAQQSTN